jgi:hypothetical protein
MNCCMPGSLFLKKHIDVQKVPCFHGALRCKRARPFNSLSLSPFRILVFCYPFYYYLSFPLEFLKESQCNNSEGGTGTPGTFLFVKFIVAEFFDKRNG